MKIQVNNTVKLVSIWLTGEEGADKALRNELKSLYAEYKAKKFKVAVFESGNNDLYDLTEALIKDNKYKLYKYDKEADKESDNKAVGF